MVRLPVREKLALATLSIVAWTVGLIVVFVFYDATHAVRTKIRSELQTHADHSARTIDHYISERFAELHLITLNEGLSSPDPSDIHRYFDRVTVASPQIESVALYDRKGRCTYASYPKWEGTSYRGFVHERGGSEFDMALDAKAGEVVFVDPALGETAVALMTPVDLPITQGAGVLEMRFELSSIGELFDDREGLESSALVDQHGRVLATAEGKWSYRRNLENVLAEFDTSMGEILSLDSEGETHLAGLSKLSGFGVNGAGNWAVLYVSPQSHAEAALRTLNWRIGAVAVLSAIAALVLAYHLARHITSRLQRLSKAAGEVAQGDLSIRTEFEEEDEFGALSQAFDEMVTEFQINHDALTQSQNRLSASAQFASALTQNDASVVYRFALLCLASEAKVPFAALFLNMKTDESTEDNILCKIAVGVDHQILEGELLSPDGLPRTVIETGKVHRVDGPFEIDNAAIRVGLGPARIKATIGWPIMFRERCLGALITGHFFEMASYQRTFIEQSTDQLGVRLHSMISEEFREQALEDLRVQSATLERARAEAEAANASKSQFLANMSHEIRTPMNSILGFTEILGEPNLSTDDRDAHLDTIRRNTRHLLAVINDILDLSKVEAGKLDVERIACSPSEIILDVESLLRKPAEEKRLNFSVHYDTPIPETVHSDPTRLRQIVLNLVSNAVKFTQQGSIRVGLFFERHPGGTDGTLTVSVEDTGPGMTTEQIQTVFAPFCQADNSMTRKHGGTGLGLTISKKLASCLGGDLTVESKFGQGSTFTLTIRTGDIGSARMIIDPYKEPLSVPKRIVEDETKGPNIDLKGRVLIVDDQPDNRRLLSAILGRAGHETQCVENGALAVEEAMNANDSGKPYDLLLMDMQMPVLDGYGASRALREKGYQGHIIALTAHSMDGDREKCLKAGCDDFTTKPVNRKRLLAKIAVVLKRRVEEPS